MTEQTGPPVWAFAIYPDDVAEYQSPVAILIERPADDGWTMFPYDDSISALGEELSKMGTHHFSYGDLVEFLRIRHFHTKAIVWHGSKPTVFYAR